MRSVEMKNRCLLYYGNPVGYRTEQGVVADSMFRREELEDWLARKGLAVRWEDGIYDRLSSGGYQKAADNGPALKSCRIWQLGPSAPAAMRFIGLDRMSGEYGGPDLTRYMDEVGRYPLHISDYDKTVLAIRDGEFDAFKNLYPRVSDQTDDLLIEVAGRPGVVGGNMTLILLAAVERFSPEAYLTACKRAVETGDSWRVQTLVKESEGRLSEPLPSLHGEVILYAYTNNCRNIAKDLIAQCTPEQIASVPPKLLRWVAEKLDFQTAVDLVDKGVRPGDEVVGILRTLTGQHQEWMAERLLEHGMPVEPDNYDALYACVSNQAVGAAKLLLDRGIDLEQYQLWAEHRPKGDGYTETMEELAAYWSELQNSTQPEDSPMKGMNL